MQTTFRFKLHPNQTVFKQMIDWQSKISYVKNRMIGDREFTYHRHFVMGDYCALHNKQTYTVSALRSDLTLKANHPDIFESFEALSSGLFCSVNRSVSLGDPWKTGDEKRARPRKPKVGKEPKKPSVKRSNYEVQASYLPKLKQEKPELAIVNAFVLQKAVNNVDEAFQKFFRVLGGYPNYTRPHDQGFEFDPKAVKLDLKAYKIYLSGLGWVRFYNSRQWWDGIEIGKTTITKEADGFYVSILIKDDSIPDVPIISNNQIETVIGGDMGIKKLLSTSGKIQYLNPQFKKVESRKLKIRQRRASKKRKGSKNRKKANIKVAKIHQKIARKRNDYQNKVAKTFVSQADMNVVEDLNISGMKKRCRPKVDENGKYIKNGQTAKSALNEAISDAAWYQLRTKIAEQSRKQGKKHVVVLPHHTSQECPECHHISADNRDKEKFVCSECGHFNDADNNAGVNIGNKGIEQEMLNLDRVRLVRPEFTPQIRLRRNHLHGQVSRGTSEYKVDKKENWMLAE
ncbi:MAG: transposase [Stigonema ocellatum SAG 48.90 = DSM 106950]|nr:transposase [Stigonema ocellatum SAG 48.90 = DSM 106950]